jgi:hypothetical protein
LAEAFALRTAGADEDFFFLAGEALFEGFALGARDAAFRVAFLALVLDSLGRALTTFPESLAERLAGVTVDFLAVFLVKADIQNARFPI